MNRVRVTQLAVPPDPDRLYSQVAPAGGALLLESVEAPRRGGRWSLIVWEPFADLWSKNGQAYLNHQPVPGDPLDILATELRRFSRADLDLPWVGGAVGYLSYDLGRQLEHLPELLPDDLSLPDLHLAFYDQGLLIDGESGRVLAVIGGYPAGDGQSAERLIESRLARLRELLSVEVPAAEESLGTGKLESNLSPADYVGRVRQAKEYIAAGDIFQVNLSQRFVLPVQGSPWAWYRQLRLRNPAPYAAFMPFPEGTILSSSPESFLKVEGSTVESRPIKGTRPRGEAADTDQAAATALWESEKDRAELTMIVDLLRNDLGRVAVYGGVLVPELLTLEEHPTVWHLVSRITGRLRPDAGVPELIRATFPGGSITGAPKIRAMEIIEELETVRRGIYTGSLGYLSFHGRLELNIAIRTIFLRDGRAYFGAGGGIVADSDPEAEYRESLQKARALWEALGSGGPRR